MFKPITLESPLHYFHGALSRNSATRNSASASLFNGDAEYRLVIKETTLSAHLNLRGDGSNPNFCSGVAEALGLIVPLTPGTYKCNGNTSVYWLGPSEWLVVEVGGDSEELEARLRKSLTGHISIVDVSGGQTCINLRGTGAATVLKKSSLYDFEGWDNATSTGGRVVQTNFAKASAIISNKSDDSYDLVIRRSFADYVAHWLLDAGEEFGCRIEKE